MIIRIRVIPNGDENEVVGRIGSVVRVKVVAPKSVRRRTMFSLVI